MKASLVSREVIADSIETVTFGESMDGLIVVAACDKNMPGAMMAIARCNVPSIFVYGGAIMPGNWRGNDINIQDMYEAIGAYSQGQITLDELIGMERVACPGEGACAGMFTANTMSSAIEAMGMSIPGAASVPAIDPRNDQIAFDSGEVIYKLLEQDLKPRDIMTREAFENAIRVVLAMGGSTNAALHLLAIAHEADVELELEDFDRLSRTTPYITDLRPGGRFVMSDMDKVGGVPVVMKELANAGLIHQDCMTITGKTVGENLAEVETEPDERVIYSVPNAKSDTGGLVILKGNLAPEGCVMKVSGTQRLKHEGPAKVYDGERAAFEAITAGELASRRRPSPALRRPQGRPRNAGNARRNRRHDGHRHRRTDPAHDRRTLLRRIPRPHHRTRSPRSRRRRPHRPSPRRRHNQHGRRNPPAKRQHIRRRDGSPPRRVAAPNPAPHDRSARQIRQASIIRVKRRRNNLIQPKVPFH